jgi:putative FmdB family regulatory protein
MPLYEYRCEACEHQFEVIQKFSDPHVAVCPKCASGPVVKLLSSPAFQFKGTGWYITDYARKDKDGAKSSGSSGEGGEKPAESKPASTDSAPSSPSSTAAPRTEGS